MNQQDQIYDQCLVARCREGDPEALEKLLSRWQERLWRHALRVTGDSEAAWDVLQETMIVISRKVSGLVDPAAFPGWAYRVATNKCRDAFRRAHRQRLKMEAYLDHAPPQVIGDAAERIDLQEARNRLSGAEQMLISLRYDEGFSMEEIAEILGVKSGTVKTRLHRARQRLRKLLEGTV